jgi:hypothetical protein
MSNDTNNEQEPAAAMPERITLRLDDTSIEQLALLRQRSGEQSVSALLKLALAQAVAEEPEAQPRADNPQVAPPPTARQHAPAQTPESLPEPAPSPEPEPTGQPEPNPWPLPSPVREAAPAVTGIADGRQVRLFTLAFDPFLGLFDDQGLRTFLTGRELLAIDKQFFQQDGRSYWAVWVEYRSRQAPGEAGAQRNHLSGEDLRLYEALRDWRRETAEANNIPVYAVATNRQLEAIARGRPGSRGALAQIQGFGKQKLARYGDAILGLLTAFLAG